MTDVEALALELWIEAGRPWENSGDTWNGRPVLEHVMMKFRDEAARILAEKDLDNPA